MSWSRRAFIAALPLGLAGCFRPMLAEGTAGRAMLGRVALPTIQGRFGYHLVKRLEDRLGKPVNPAWRLEVATELEETGLGIAQDNSVTRITLKVDANWALYAKGADTPALTDHEVSQSGYNSTTSLFATRQTRRDIERRLAEDIAERIARTVLARAGQLTG